VLSRLNPIEEPAATVTVSEAGRGDLLQVISGEVTLSTGELFNGWRTAAVDCCPPATTVVQMSENGVMMSELLRREVESLTVSGHAVSSGADDGDSREELHCCE
jgi:hypothetical protein